MMRLRPQGWEDTLSGRPAGRSYSVGWTRGNLEIMSLGRYDMSKLLRPHGLVLLAYTVVALLMTYPVFLQLDTFVAGVGGDPWQTMWRFEDRAFALQSAFSHSQLGPFMLEEFFGGGPARLVNNSVWPWLPLHLAFGEPIAYNLVWLLSYILSGYAMWLLIRYLLPASRPSTMGKLRLSPRDSAALLAGLFYMLAPYHMAQSLGHFGAMQLQWLPLALLLTFLFIDRPSLPRAVGLVAVLTMQSWTEHHYLLWYGLFLFIYIGTYWPLIRGRVWATRAAAGASLALSVMVLLFVVLPWWPTIRLAWAESSVLALGREQSIRFSADIFSFVVPAVWHPIWGETANILFAQHFTGNVSEATHFLGWLPLLLTIFFHQRIPRRAKLFWSIIAITFGLISLGPRLHIVGHILPLPLPWALVDSWPGFNAVRAVARASVMILIALSVLFGWVIATQVKRPWLIALAGVTILIEFLLIPVPMQSARLSPAYAAIKELSGSALIELPAATNYTAASRALYAGANHGKSVIGSIALERALGSDPLEEIRSLPVLRYLLYLRTNALLAPNDEFFSQAPRETLADTLRYLDVGGILIHLDSLSVAQVSIVRNFLEKEIGLEPLSFDDAILYVVPREFLASGDGIFITRDNKWQNVRTDEAQTRQAYIVRTAKLTVFNSNDQERIVDLAFLLSPQLMDSLNIQVDGQERFETRLELDTAGRSHHRIAVAARSRVTLNFESRLTQPINILDPQFLVVP